MVLLAIRTFEFELTHAGEDEETGAHPKGTKGEALATAEFLDHVKTWEGADDVDGAEDDLSDKGVFDADTREDGGAVVHEVIHTL